MTEEFIEVDRSYNRLVLREGRIGDYDLVILPFQKTVQLDFNNELSEYGTISRMSNAFIPVMDLSIPPIPVNNDFNYDADIDIRGAIKSEFSVIFTKNGRDIGEFNANVWGASFGVSGGLGNCKMNYDIEYLSSLNSQSSVSLLGAAGGIPDTGMGVGYTTVFFHVGGDTVGTCFILMDGSTLQVGASGIGHFSTP